MTITTIPTRNPADLGAALYDARTPNANELAAVNVEKIKDRVIEVATEIGLSSGLTSGSINEMRAAFTAGAYSSILRRIGSAYGSQRIGGGLSAPTVDDDSGEGYAPGSWWVQVAGIDNPATLAFFVCVDSSAGAAVWVQIRDQRRRLVTTITTSQAITAATEIAHVSTAGGAVSLTLPNPAIAYDFAVKKTNTGTNGITIVPHDTSGSGPTIEGGAAGASLVLSGSTSAARGYWYLYSDGTNWWTA